MDFPVFHLDFVNLMGGGSTLTLVCEIIGLKKREGFPAMPAFRLPEAEFRQVADYILELGSPAAPPEEATESRTETQPEGG